MIWWILGVILWILIALWPARVAAAKGHSFIGYFLLSIPFWWITLFIVYFGLQDKTSTPKPA
jgi:ABC-type dipeptide/oligopeptide/nickel transport system permease component